jgi:hypothetical protein
MYSLSPSSRPHEAKFRPALALHHICSKTSQNTSLISVPRLYITATSSGSLLLKANRFPSLVSSDDCFWTDRNLMIGNVSHLFPGQPSNSNGLLDSALLSASLINCVPLIPNCKAVPIEGERRLVLVWPGLFIVQKIQCHPAVSSLPCVVSA